MRTLSAPFWCVILAVAVPAARADWPQWRGPDRTDVAKETGLLKTWPKGGPTLAWSYAQTGVGYSGPAVVSDRLFILGTRGDLECLIALDAVSGKEIWCTNIGPIFGFKGNSWGDGPRSTPTIDGSQVLALGAQGILLCADKATGKPIWQKDLATELGGVISPHGGGPDKIGWGYSESPLVDGDQVVCTPGGAQGTLAALDKSTGKVRWRSKELTDPATYASAVVAEIAGARQYIQMTDRGVVGVAAKDGRLLWRYLRKPAYPEDTFVIPTPIVFGNEIYTTTSAGCDLIGIAAQGGKFKAVKTYSNKNMKNQTGGVLLAGDHVFGFSDGRGWVCQKLANGELAWSEKRQLGRGSLTCVDDRLYCYGEDDGKSILVQATAEGWKECGRLELPRQSQLRKPNGKCWTHPVVANGRLYLRDQENLFCFDIRDQASDRRKYAASSPIPFR
jgi:outer membrane protein assembly factor BamB